MSDSLGCAGTLTGQGLAQHTSIQTQSDRRKRCPRVRLSPPHSHLTAWQSWKAMWRTWWMGQGRQLLSLRKSKVLRPRSSKEIHMWPWQSNQSNIWTQRLGKDRGSWISNKLPTAHHPTKRKDCTVVDSSCIKTCQLISLTKARNVVHLAECLFSMHKAQGSTCSITFNSYVDMNLQFQPWGSGGSRIVRSRSSSTA